MTFSPTSHLQKEYNRAVVEKNIENTDFLPPKRWHDAIRDSLPGNLKSPNQFISFPIEAGWGLVYTVYSLTVSDEKSGKKEGIYIETNIPASLGEKAQLFLPLVTLKLALLFAKYSRESKANKFDDIFEIDNFAVTGNNNLVFSIRPESINNATVSP